MGSPAITGSQRQLSRSAPAGSNLPAHVLRRDRPPKWAYLLEACRTWPISPKTSANSKRCPNGSRLACGVDHGEWTVDREGSPPCRGPSTGHSHPRLSESRERALPSGGWAGGLARSVLEGPAAPLPMGALSVLGRFVRRYFEEAQVEPPKARLLFSVELTGFEPVAPSLRKMRSNCCDQGF